MKKHTNRAKKLNVPSSFLHILLLLFGFATGYTSNEYISTTNPLPLQRQSVPSPATNQVPTVCFTPNKQCQTQLIEQIHKAKESIYVQAYSFTDREVTDALVKAAQRGVSVKVLLDKSNRNDHRSAKDMIMSNNIPLLFDYPPGIAHNKVMVIDQSTVITGSYNFSVSAYKRNTENLLVLNNKPLAKQYIQNWLKRWDISKERELSHG